MSLHQPVFVLRAAGDASRFVPPRGPDRRGARRRSAGTSTASSTTSRSSSRWAEPPRELRLFPIALSPEPQVGGECPGTNYLFMGDFVDRGFYRYRVMLAALLAFIR